VRGESDPDTYRLKRIRQRNRAVELDMVKVSRWLHRQTQAGRIRVCTDAGWRHAL